MMKFLLFIEIFSDNQFILEDTAKSINTTSLDNHLFERKLSSQNRSEILSSSFNISLIHQTADFEQNEILKKADDALTAKREAAGTAETLTALDAMKIQIANLRQQYLKALAAADTPDIDVVTINRTSVCFSAKLENEEDIDKYLAELRERLIEKLSYHDVLHII